MSRCLLVGAAPGSLEVLASLLRTHRFEAIYAIDGGYEALERCGVVPSGVFGDFDSLGFVPAHPNVEAFPSHKDYTDMDWALNHVLEEGFEEVFLCGGLAGRLDHSIGNLQLMIAYAQRGLRVWGFTESEVVVPLVAPGPLSRLAFDPVPEGTLSFMAHSSEVRGVTERGLEYEVSDGTFTALSPWGVSNEFVGKPASVSIDEGSAWAFFPYVALPQAHWGACCE